jgi:hypothetical protein
MKFVPVTVSVNAALPAVVELGFRDPVASEGLGLGVGDGVLLEPLLHPTNDPDTNRHNINPPRRRLENDGPKPMSCTTAPKDSLVMFIAPPLIDLAFRGLGESLACFKR